MGRASKDKRDIYYRKAKEEGFRARSAYKLLQIDEEFGIFHGVRRAVDLCAAPGSWSQVLAAKLSETSRVTRPPRAEAGDVTEAKRCAPFRIVAVDLQEMAPIQGVSIFQGDITSEETARGILDRLAMHGDGDADEEVDEATERGAGGGGDGRDAEGAATRGVGGKRQRDADRSVAVGLSVPSAVAEAPARGGGPSPAGALAKADLVVCDGAPDVTGMHELDEYVQHQLLLAALRITTCVLAEGGCFVSKMFRGPNTPFLVAKSEIFFDSVVIVKPKSSRNASMESFMVCQGFRIPPGLTPTLSGPYVTDRIPATPTVGTGVTHSAPPHGAPLAHGAVAISNFLSCGALTAWDADMCYDREAGKEVLAPLHPPIQAPYLPPPGRPGS